MKTNTLDFDAQALRERILDLAMRGKLVPQDPNDEPASVLLEKIKAEKEKLVKEKKIKKTKALPAITDDEKPFDIPDSWEWVRLGDVVDVRGGRRVPKGKKLVDYQAVKPYIRVTDMSDYTVDTNNLKYVTQDIYDQIKNYTISSNDIYFSIAGTIGKVGAIPEKINNALLTENAAKLTPYNFNKEFLIHVLNSNFVKKQHEKILSQVAQSKLSLIKLRRTVIPMPPFLEQGQIVAKVKQLFALIKRIEVSAHQYEELQLLLRSKVLDLAVHGKLVKQNPDDEPVSTLLKKIRIKRTELIKAKKIKRTRSLPLITDEEKPFDIPDSWEWVRLGNVITILRGASPRPIKNYLTNDPNGINWIKIGDSTKDSKYIDHAAEKIKTKGLSKTRLVHKGDFLLSNSMSFGRPYILKIDGAVHDGWLILSNYSKIFDKNFLYYLLSSKLANNQFALAATGSTVKNLNRERVANTMVVVPPISEQERIVNEIMHLYKYL